MISKPFLWLPHMKSTGSVFPLWICHRTLMFTRWSHAYSSFTPSVEQPHWPTLETETPFTQLVPAGILQHIAPHCSILKLQRLSWQGLAETNVCVKSRAGTPGRWCDILTMTLVCHLQAGDLNQLAANSNNNKSNQKCLKLEGRMRSRSPLITEQRTRSTALKQAQYTTATLCHCYC